MSASGETKRMVIVGGDFAGLACAGELARTDEVQATLTDNNNFQQFQPLLYQLAMAKLGDDVATFLRESLRGLVNVDVELAEMIAAVSKARSITTREDALEQAERLRSRILTVFEDRDGERTLIEKGALHSAIVGGGPTGRELAGAALGQATGLDAHVSKVPDLPRLIAATVY